MNDLPPVSDDLDSSVSRRRPPRLWALVAGMVVGFVALGLLLVAARPLEFAEIRSRFQLWRVDAHPFEWQGLRGIEQNRCEFQGTNLSADPSRCVCVLFVHGMGDSLSTWKRVFLAEKGEFKFPARFLAVDVPGFGTSDVPADPAGLRVRNLAKRLSQWIDSRADCGRTMVVGNSFGGWIAAWMGIEGTKKIDRLVLLAPVGLKSVPLPTRDLLKEPTVESLKEFQRLAYAHPRELSDSQWKAAAQRLKYGKGRDVENAQTADDALDTQLAGLKKIVTVVHGQADRIVPDAYLREFAKLIRGALYSEIPECGHMPQKECPAAVVKVMNESIAYGVM